MRILQLHSNFIVFKPIEKEINIAEEATKEETKILDSILHYGIEQGEFEVPDLDLTAYTISLATQGDMEF